MDFLKAFLGIIIFTELCFTQDFSSSEKCKSCHTQTYKQWQQSRHALSSEIDSPLYKAMLRDHAPSDVNTCKKCHEPIYSLNLSDNSAQKLSREGISCDFCHATELVTKGDEANFKLVHGNIKFGPFKDAVAINHQSQYSDDLNDPKFCLACHTNQDSPHGITFIDLEEEWKNSSYYKQNITCQDCHLPSVSGKTAALGKIRDNIYSHQFFGGYNDEILTNCVSMEVDTSRENHYLLVTIKIKNSSVGHGLPSASPLRMVILTVEGIDELNNTIWKNYLSNPIKDDPQAVFMKLLEDSNGRAPILPWKAVGERFDSRLMPEEERTIKYQIPAEYIKSIRASLAYYIAPPPLLSELMILDPRYTKVKIINTTLLDIP
ncbi:hypothetical protein JXQ31_10510 [candidate division KSB1 bacterium]|nr:hypothetical protein [candidate division KSB1 bacterium]